MGTSRGWVTLRTYYPYCFYSFQKSEVDRIEEELNLLCAYSQQSDNESSEDEIPPTQTPLESIDEIPQTFVSPEPAALPPSPPLVPEPPPAPPLQPQPQGQEGGADEGDHQFLNIFEDLMTFEIVSVGVYK